MRISDWSSDVCSSDLPAMNAHHAAPADFIATEHRLGAHNYKPLDVILTRGEGVGLWDVDGNRYMDCLSAYSAVHQGHCTTKTLNRKSVVSGQRVYVRGDTGGGQVT